jgi:murein DD-endopeptidase MepM/ murein hydrolase activator NlpD
MNSSFFMSFFTPVFILFILVFFICIFYTPLILNYFNNGNTLYSLLSTDDFIWPTEEYKTITSYFGNRVAPASGASTFHSGIDIAAPTGTKIVSVFSGIITYTGFSGAGGYTITVTANNFIASYCHVSPISWSLLENM